jgi:hypothetical protein
MENSVLSTPRMPTGWLVFATDSSERYFIAEAATPSEVMEAQQLRFEVFNMELKEGLVTSFISGRDEDPFDAVCNIAATTAKRSLTSLSLNFSGAKFSNWAVLVCTPSIATYECSPCFGVASPRLWCGISCVI